MKDMEKQKFEQEWKDAFDQAEVSPSDNLWTNIELNLEKADATKMKSRLQFYKLMAAASVLFAVCMAGAFAYYYNTLTTNGNDQFVANEKKKPEEQMQDKPAFDDSESELLVKESDIQPLRNQKAYVAEAAVTTVEKDDVKNAGSNRRNTEESRVAMSEGLRAGHHNQENNQRALMKSTRSHTPSDGETSVALQTTNDVESIHKGEQNKNNIDTHNNDATSQVVLTGVAVNSEGLIVKGETDVPIQTMLHERNLPSLTNSRKITIKWPEQDPVAVMMARLAQRERELGADDEPKQPKPKSAKREERLWTSLGMAAGAFNNLNHAASGVNNNSTFASNNVTANQSNASGTSYSVGMNIGTRLSSRWVLQGGVNYLAQNSSYEANSVVGTADNLNFQAASIDALSSRNSAVQANKLVATVPYSVDNSVRFMSVPVQAGYMVINRTVGVQLNGGVSTDLFLQNTLTPQSSSLPTITKGSGEDSPYRTVNFSGLVGTELSYRFSRHYRLALNPGLRYPLNSIYKSDVGVKSSPLTFDVGLRFRYIFH